MPAPATFASRPTREGGWCLSSSRPGAAACEIPLDAVDGLLYAACDDGASEAELAALVRVRLPDTGVADTDLRGRLSSFVDRGLMVATGERYLSLALPASARDVPA